MMDPSRPATGGVDIFGLSQRRMQWLEQREQTLASNIANADTPDYVASDMTPFESALAEFDVGLITTSSRHIPMVAKRRARTESSDGEHSPDGNGVSLETQMQLVAETSDQQRLATSVYSTYRTMVNNVLGK